MLVGMQTGAAAVENSMEFPQKIKNRMEISMLNEISQRKTNTIKSHLYVESNEQNKPMKKIEPETWKHGAD